MQFKYKYGLIVKNIISNNSVLHKYAISSI